MEAKGFSLAILGDPGVGKTSLCYCLTDKPLKETHEPTNGCEYYQKIFRDTKNNQILKIDIYCASGDKRSEKLTKYIYKDATCIILMFNLNDIPSFVNIKNYLDNVRMNSVEEPLLYLVGNFGDEPVNEVTTKMIDEFKRENGISEIKYKRITCKKKKSVDELLAEITKDVSTAEKYYTSTIDKDISDISSMEDGGKEIEKMTKSLKTLYKDTKEKKANFIRCKNCHKLLYIKFRNTYNEVAFICDYCNKEHNINIEQVEKYIDQLTAEIICFECKKLKKDRIELEYCNKCKHYVCGNCKKNIIKQLKAEGSEIHKLTNYYLMDIYCFEHGKKVLGFCKTCKKNFCISCFENHKTHENIFYENIIKKLLDEHAAELKAERENLNEFIRVFEECMKSLKIQVNNFIALKMREIKLKEHLFNQLFTIKYNQQLIETFRTMKYMKKKEYNMQSWDKTLQDIFETMGHPIQIKNINISRKKENISPSIIDIKERLKEELNEHGNHSKNRIAELMKEITDFCSMNNDKYIGISYNSGELEIYDAFMDNYKLLNTIQIFKNEPINSMHKSTLNVNNYFFCGKGSVKNLEFYNRYTTNRTNLEILDPKRTYKYAIDQENFIVTCDEKNNIILYDKEGKELGNITTAIEKQGAKEINKIEQIMNNVIYINYTKSKDDTIVAEDGQNMSEQDETNNDISMNRNSIKEQKITGTKIIEFDGETQKIKKEHVLSETQELIGVVNNRLAIIRDDAFNTIILFDGKTFKNVQRFFFEVGEKPIYCSTLAKRNNLIDFVLVSDQMKMLQNIYDEDHKNITQISGVKFKVREEENEEKVVKEGKIIHIPFKGFIKYIGDNNFVFINY